MKSHQWPSSDPVLKLPCVMQLFYVVLIWMVKIELMFWKTMFCFCVGVYGSQMTRTAKHAHMRKLCLHWMFVQWPDLHIVFLYAFDDRIVRQWKTEVLFCSHQHTVAIFNLFIKFKNKLYCTTITTCTGTNDENYIMLMQVRSRETGQSNPQRSKHQGLRLPTWGFTIQNLDIF